MRMIARFTAASAMLVLIAACADVPSGPTSDISPLLPRATLVDATTGATIELKRPKVDVTGWLDETESILASAVLPAAATGIGPGSAILITIPGEGRFGCTANFVWRQNAKYYLGSAGHCFLPAVKKSTHGAGADYDASGVKVQVCVEGCEGNFRTALLVGKFVTLGPVAYARQTDPTGTEDVGNDFGVVEIPSGAEHLIRPAMPVWGGPKGVEELEAGKFGCHYGNGLLVGETFVTKARVGLGGGGDKDWWMGDFAGAFGDSGSGLNSCEQSGLGFTGTGGAGVLTHLGVEVCPCDVKYKNVRIKAEHGLIFGTTMRRSVEMAREAGLSLTLVDG